MQCAKGASRVRARKSPRCSDRVTSQELLQCNQPAAAIPESHMLRVWNQKQFAARRHLGETLGGSDRRAAAPAHVVVAATENQRRHFHFGGFCKSIPSKAGILVAAKHFHRTLSRPNRIGEGRDHFWMLAIEFWGERHRVVLDVVADVTLKADIADFALRTGGQATWSTGERFRPRARSCDGQRCYQIGSLDSHRLHDLSAESKTNGVTA